MSNLEIARRAADAAAQRRAHLSARALLAGMMRASSCLVRTTFRIRARLDPSGGAYDATLAHA